MILLFFLQFSFLPPLGVSLNLILVFILVLAQKRFDYSGIMWIAAAGFLAEIFSSGASGATVLTFGLLVLGYRAINSLFVAFESNRLLISVVYAGGMVVFDVLSHYLNSLVFFWGGGVREAAAFPNILSLEYLFKMVFFAIASYVMLLVYEKFEKISGEKGDSLIIKNN